MVIENRAAVSASFGWFGPRPPGICYSLLFERSALRVLRDPEDHELGRLDRRDPELDGEDAGVAVLRRVVLLVALDVERLGRGAAEQRAVPPHPAQEHGDRPPHRRSEEHTSE